MSIRKFFTRVRAAIVGAVMAVLAAIGIYNNAETQTPTWNVSATMPTQYMDNSALPVTDLASYTVVWKLNGGATQTKVVSTGIAATVSTTIPKELGTTCVAMFVTTKATARSPNSSSTQTADVCATFAGIPKVPTDLAVQ